MDDFDKGHTETIIDILTKRLGRKLSTDESEAFGRARSGIAYEMMIDFISDSEMTKEEIEQYTESVTIEHKNDLGTKF